MASSYFTESEAPRDFKVSSTESDGHYKKCLLCYTVKKNFYCADCIKAGNFVYSSMPYSDRFSEKQAKLLRLKVNRKHVLDRCERLLAPKLKKDSLLTEAKQSRDKLGLLRLAIEQRKMSIEEKRKELNTLVEHNNELSLKLPRYQKRVASLGKHAQMQRIELHNKMIEYNEQADNLAALRRARIRQLTSYIFPVYMSYDTSDSIEDMEFIGDDVEEPPKKLHLHIVNPSISIDGDCTQLQTWSGAGGTGGAGEAGGAGGAALGLAAQLVALLAWTLDVRLPLPISLNARLASACAALWCGAGVWPARAAHALEAPHALALAASADDPLLGREDACRGEDGARVMEWCSTWDACAGAGAGMGGAGVAGGLDDPHEHEDAEPEHLHWPETAELEEVSSSPPVPAPAPSLVTSAAASLASVWRGWTK
ncbi:hypothetical protein O3G_MSEX009072 [Manduca sexta]|uniref:Beclin 1-associated autophagy-related key regulator n=1 Tax=Manduca sexta TaxID=7130 RepID=A0A922CRH8_MANSE|nr:hypothetical protein O3G_MSEX009072 [Manduca sexta]